MLIFFIDDIMLIAKETVDEKKQGEARGVTFKTDLEKAYDQTYGVFLDPIYNNERLWTQIEELNDKMLVLCYWCNSSKQDAKRWMGASNVWQGDPLSPFVFTLVVNMQSRVTFKRISCRNELKYSFSYAIHKWHHFLFKSLSRSVETLKLFLLVLGIALTLKSTYSSGSIFSF